MIYKSYCCILSEYLNPTEVEYIHGFAKNLPLQEGRLGFGGQDTDSQTAREGKSGTSDNKIRQSTNKWINHEVDFDLDLKQKIFDGMMQANQMSGWNYEVDNMEQWQYTVYDHNPDAPTGDFYTWHTDCGPEPYSNGKTRKLSASIQLSCPDDYEGGHFQWIEQTDVFDSLKTRDQVIRQDDLICSAPMSGKELGSLIVFPSWLHHQVTPVTKGTRKSLVVWNTGWPLK